MDIQTLFHNLLSTGAPQTNRNLRENEVKLKKKEKKEKNKSVK